MSARDIECIVVLRSEWDARKARAERAEAELERLRASQWQPIETAPKDGTRILAVVVHSSAEWSKNPIRDGFVGVVTAYWTTFNKGGWVYHGLYGNLTHWQPLPEPPQ